MLTNLHIKNFALVDNLEISFGKGLNIITGETGAGKSIIVDALMMVLGERASADFVRFGETKAIVEGEFEISPSHPLNNILSELEIESNGSLIIRREIQSKGTSRCFINDSPVQLSQLKQFGDLLVDFHGQHEHQLLLKNETHIEVLDSAISDSSLKSNYIRDYERLAQKIKEYRELKDKEKNLKEKEQYQRFELSEIEKVNPKPNEFSDLEEELKILENAEWLHSQSSELFTLLYESEESVHDKLTQARKNLGELSKIDGKFKEYHEECSSAMIALDEIAKFAQNYISSVHYDEQRIEEIRVRLLDLKHLIKKYGSLEDTFAKWEQLEKDLKLVSNFETEINGLKQQISILKKELGKTASALSNERKKTAKIFEKKIVEILKNLGIENSVFQVKFENTIAENKVTEISAVIGNQEFKAMADGIDRIEFYITTNKGEEPKPLAEVASGGEISRIMLAIKSIVAESENLPILVFDEIDSGISGRVGQKVGFAMKKMAYFHQVIAITHLPQIAALGDVNIAVEKKESNGRNIVSATAIDESRKLLEIAKLISGEDVTKAALANAEDLMNYKE